MNPLWYLNRLRKMPPGEIWKRLTDEVSSTLNAVRYEKRKTLYEELGVNYKIVLKNLPYGEVARDVRQFSIYGEIVDLTGDIDWHRAPNEKWPNIFYKKINYRPGNPHGDIRINWELNRLQFLPLLATQDKTLAVQVLSDWLDKNPYLTGPAYVSAMEVALRWISVYRAVCIVGRLDDLMNRRLAGLAMASGNYIQNRLSTHSSAGNHLVVEALGLFWLGSALSGFYIGKQWMLKGREILWHETLRQINPDGTNGEQTFWYLGVVLDALLHYMLLEDRTVIPAEVTNRIIKSFEYLSTAVLSNGAYPDYGDRDDGFVFRESPDYDEPYFAALLDTAARMFARPDWMTGQENQSMRKEFFIDQKNHQPHAIRHNRVQTKDEPSKTPSISIFPDGGITVMKRGRGRLFFKHGPLGMAPLYGHGHADALSFSFFWNNVPVFVDPGCGQYNGDRIWRDYFRSTVAHNTICVNSTNQAHALGRFMWKDSYHTDLICAQPAPYPVAEASHDGYVSLYGIVHTRRIAWPEETMIEISDMLSGTRTCDAEGALHIRCDQLIDGKDWIDAGFDGFSVRMVFEPDMQYRVCNGSENPPAGWISPLYGQKKPICSIFYTLPAVAEVKVRIHIRETPDAFSR